MDECQIDIRCMSGQLVGLWLSPSQSNNWKKRYNMCQLLLLSKWSKRCSSLSRWMQLSSLFQCWVEELNPKRIQLQAWLPQSLQWRVDLGDYYSIPSSTGWDETLTAIWLYIIPCLFCKWEHANVNLVWCKSESSRCLRARSSQGSEADNSRRDASGNQRCFSLIKDLTRGSISVNYFSITTSKERWTALEKVSRHLYRPYFQFG